MNLKIKTLFSGFSVFVVILMLFTSCEFPKIGESELKPVVTPENLNQDRSESEPSPEPLPSDTPVLLPDWQPAEFIESQCEFELPSGIREGKDIRCGFIEVPEDRENLDSRMIKLSIAILINPQSAKFPDPIIYLEGGPGGSALEFLYLTYDRNFKPFFQSGRDILLFDQRGVGLSTPALDCPQEDQLFIELLDNEKDGKTLSREEMDALTLEAYQECAQDLNKIAALSKYNTNDNASDVNDIRTALGYDQLNLWGISYGTRLALEVMRDYPQIIRSVLLDSTYPPEVNLYAEQPASFDRVFNVFFDGCQKDPDCQAAYPDLRATFFQTVEKLNLEPAEFIVTNLLTGEEYPTIVDGDNLIGLFFQFLYDTELIPILPKLVIDINQQNYTILSLLLGSILATQSAQSDGMHYTVQCADEIPYTTIEEVVSASKAYPQFSSLFEPSSLAITWEICDAFAIPPTDPSEADPVTSTLPTLIFAGEYDPITPPQWGEMAAQSLDNSQFFVVPGYGHGVTTTEGCPREMAIEFFNNPNLILDRECIDSMEGPVFQVPDTSPVKLVDFSNPQMGIRGLAPEGWDEVNPGVFSRNNSPLDVLVVIAQAAPVSAGFLVQSVMQSLGEEQMPETIGQREANEINWDLYKIYDQGFEIDLAVANKSGLGLIVLLQSTPEEQPFFYESIFLAMVDALVPLR
jgi:pimeloyl-ACP methyl ester carboxylesterase